MDGEELQDLAGIGVNFTAESGGWSKPAQDPPNPDQARREAALKRRQFEDLMKRELSKHKTRASGDVENI